MRLVVFSFTLISLLCGKSFSNNDDFESQKAIQKIIDSIRIRKKITGIQFCYIDETNRSQCWTSGFADRKHKEPILNSNTLRIGSTTKLFTVYLIMQLVQDSRISLNDKLNKWYPEFPYSKEISVRNLLMHMSGAVEILRFPKFLLQCTFNPKKNYKVDELIAFVAKKSIKNANQPNQKYEYSNTNYILLGAIAERLYSKTFAELIEMIADEMQLRNTSYISPNGSSEQLLYGYDEDLIPFPWGYSTKSDNTSWTSLAAGSGGIISNAADLSAFFHEFISGHKFSENIKAEMLKFVPIEHEGMPYTKGIGLGVFKMEIDGKEYWGHEGQMIGSESLVLYCPENRTTYCITGNRSAFKGKYEAIVKITNELQKRRRAE